MKKELNEFFVKCFYEILNAEERKLESISNGTLSLKEIHVIEAVFKAKKEEKNNFSYVANLLGITLGSLTVSVATLARKGYLVKVMSAVDKRIYLIEPTRLAELVNHEHELFHEEMIAGIEQSLNEEEQEKIIHSLKKLQSFFKNLN